MIKKTVMACFALFGVLCMCVCAEAYEKTPQNRTKPVILSPKPGDRVYSGDSLAIRYYSKEEGSCFVVISDEEGVVFSETVKNGGLLRNDGKNTHTVGSGGVYLISPDVLKPQKNYSVQIICDFSASDPVYFNTFADSPEAINRTLKKYNAQKIYSALKVDPFFKNNILLPFQKKDSYIAELIAPKEYFRTAALSRQMMEDIEVKVKKLDKNGKLYTSVINLTVNKNLKNNYINIFRELYDLSFPIKSAGCYNYRNTRGGRLSEHALGTAIDINPDENYCIYSDGARTGSMYRPYSNPYSVTPEVVNVFKKYGFGWGGEWTGTVDYMHFSYFNT